MEKFCSYTGSVLIVLGSILGGALMGYLTIYQGVWQLACLLYSGSENTSAFAVAIAYWLIGPFVAWVSAAVLILPGLALHHIEDM